MNRSATNEEIADIEGGAAIPNLIDFAFFPWPDGTLTFTSFAANLPENPWTGNVDVNLVFNTGGVDTFPPGFNLNYITGETGIKTVTPPVPATLPVGTTWRVEVQVSPSVAPATNLARRVYAALK